MFLLLLLLLLLLSSQIFSWLLACFRGIIGMVQYGLVWFNILIDTLLVFPGTIFPACSHLTGKAEFKPNQTATKLQHRTTQTTLSTYI